MSAKVAILGLLVEQPFHGYGVERVIEQRGMRKWTSIGFSSIYHVLDQLVDERLAEVKIEPAPGRGKERRVHYVTPEGRRLWTTSTLDALREVDDSDSGFLTALSGLPLLDQSAAVEALEQRRDLLKSQITGLDTDRNAVVPVPDHVEAMFSYTRSRLVASLSWLTDFLSTISTPSTEARPWPAST